MLFYKKPLLVQAGVTAGFNSGVNFNVFSDWINWEIIPERIGAGTMKLGIDYSWDKTTGTWTLLKVSDVFALNEYFFIQFEPSDSILTPVSDNGEYTNGFNRAKVTNALLGRLAWRQPTVSGAPVLTSANNSSGSGRYFDGFHALSNIMNVKSTMQDKDANDTTFNAFLQSLYQDIMMRCVTGIFSQYELIEQTMAYDRISPSINQQITSTGQFAGYEIEVVKDNHVSIQIHSVTLLFTEDKTFNLYLFADGDPNPLVTKSVTCQANRPTIVTIDNLIFGYINSNARNRKYYFGYFQNDLGTAKAIMEQACLTPSLMYCAEPCTLRVSGSSPDYTQVAIPALPYGLNLELSSFKDHTDKIIKNAFLFDEVIGLQMAAQVVENIMHSNRSNSDERKLKDGIDKLMVYMDLKGTVPISDAPSTTGLSKQIEREMVRLRQTFYPKPKAFTVNAYCED
jgi:hypothetical protein